MASQAVVTCAIQHRKKINAKKTTYSSSIASDLKSVNLVASITSRGSRRNSSPHPPECDKHHELGCTASTMYPSAVVGLRGCMESESEAHSRVLSNARLLEPETSYARSYITGVGTATNTQTFTPGARPTKCSHSYDWLKSAWQTLFLPMDRIRAKSVTIIRQIAPTPYPSLQSPTVNETMHPCGLALYATAAAHIRAL